MMWNVDEHENNEDVFDKVCGLSNERIQIIKGSTDSDSKLSVNDHIAVGTLQDIIIVCNRVNHRTSDVQKLCVLTSILNMATVRLSNDTSYNRLYEKSIFMMEARAKDLFKDMEYSYTNANHETALNFDVLLLTANMLNIADMYGDVNFKAFAEIIFVTTDHMKIYMAVYSPWKPKA